MTADIYTHTGEADVMKDFDLITGNISDDTEEKNLSAM